MVARVFWDLEGFNVFFSDFPVADKLKQKIKMEKFTSEVID